MIYFFGIGVLKDCKSSFWTHRKQRKQCFVNLFKSSLKSSFGHDKRSSTDLAFKQDIALLFFASVTSLAQDIVLFFFFAYVIYLRGYYCNLTGEECSLTPALTKNAENEEIL